MNDTKINLSFADETVDLLPSRTTMSASVRIGAKNIAVVGNVALFNCGCVTQVNCVSICQS